MTTLNEKIEDLRNKWLNKEITLWDLNEITETDMTGNYDLKRDLMSCKNEGSYDFQFDCENEECNQSGSDGTTDNLINIEFTFLEGEEIEFNGKVIITHIYAI